MRRPQRPGLIVRQKAPLNLEYQFASLSDWITPTAEFYVRSHFPFPDIDAAAWRLKVTGAVTTPLDLSFEALKALPQATLPAVMECAGNGRVFYEPAKEGLQWQSGAVGNANWTGVRLAHLLAMAGLPADAVEIVIVGADRGVVDGGKKTASPGPIAFARSIPVVKALSEGVILAHSINDEPLTAEHGFPLRAIVGGWFGMAWVKWITEIRVVTRPFLGYWQARDYFRWERGLGEPTLVPLTEMEVKAQIAQPVQGATLHVGTVCRIFGAAWSGEAPVSAVEVSTGGDWLPVTLLGPEEPFAWRLFAHEWTPETPGRYVLRCRARDAAGNVQPEEQQQDRESYVANWIVPVEVEVVADDEPDDSFVI